MPRIFRIIDCAFGKDHDDDADEAVVVAVVGISLVVVGAWVGGKRVVMSWGR